MKPYSGLRIEIAAYIFKQSKQITQDNYFFHHLVKILDQYTAMCGKTNKEHSLFWLVLKIGGGIKYSGLVIIRLSKMLREITQTLSNAKGGYKDTHIIVQRIQWFHYKKGVLWSAQGKS